MDVFEQSKLENDAYDHWKSFVHEITYKNRFFPQHPIVELFQSYTENHFSHCQKELSYIVQELSITTLLLLSQLVLSKAPFVIKNMVHLKVLMK